MKITININDKATEIELTEDQVAKVKKQNTKVTDRIKTFEDACAELGYDHAGNELFVTDEYGVGAFVKLQIIVKALNESWNPDWTNSTEYKYYPYFNMEGSFSYNCCDFFYSFSNVGSRLCYKTRELAEYASKQFTELYKELSDAN